MNKPNLNPSDITYDTQDLISTAEVEKFSFDREIGAQLKKLRRGNNLTLNKLGKVLDISGQQIQKYERGVNSISAAKLAELSRFFGVSVATFYEGIEKEFELAEGSQSSYGTDSFLSHPSSSVSNEKIFREFVELFMKCSFDEQRKLVETMKIWARDK